jgi:hypothetical protein
MAYTIRKSNNIVTKKYLNECESIGMSEDEIAKSLGISRVGLWKIRKKIGCMQTVRSDKGKIRVAVEEKIKRRNAYMRQYAQAHDVRYKAIRYDGKMIAEHRLVMEAHLGRKLNKGEIVHHIDGNRMNNDLSNLKLCASVKEHNELHRINWADLGKENIKDGVVSN